MQYLFLFVLLSCTVSCAVNHSFKPAEASTEQVSWPVRGGNPQHTGQSLNELLLEAAPGEGIESSWRYDSLHSYLAKQNFSHVTMDDEGHFYFQDTYRLVSLEPDGELRWSLDYNDERQQWIEPVDGIEPQICADGQIIILSTHGYLLAVSDQGEITWSYDTGEGAFLVVGNRIHFAGARNFLVLDSKGELIWESEINHDAESCQQHGFAVSPDGSVLLRGRELKLLNAEGRLVWESPIRNHGARSWDFSVYANGLWLLSAEDGILAVNDEDGSQAWHHPMQISEQQERIWPCVSREGRIYIPSSNFPSSDPDLTVLDMNGNTLWTKVLSPGPHSLQKALVLDSTGRACLLTGFEILVYDVDGIQISSIQLPDDGSVGWSRPQSLLIRRDGGLLVSFHGGPVFGLP